MNAIEIGLFVFGLLILGPFLNFAIYSFAYFPRAISPWQAPSVGIPNRNLWSRVPVLGWLKSSRQEAEIFGRFYWVRPFLIELGTPFCLVLLYRYCTDGAFMPTGLPAIPASTLQHQFIAFAALISLMTVATFIDFDERTIPDMVTIPGTLIGLVGAMVIPDWRLHESILPVFPALLGPALPMQANSPFHWDMSFHGSTGLILGLLFWSGWCFGLADRRWISRRGNKKAMEYFFERLRRSPSTKLLAVLWVIGFVGIVVAQANLDAMRWESLLSSLFGIGLGGVLVWGFRLVARLALKQEALGFGDVTLMAMIGAFFGWQIVWMAFFIAPICGLAFVIISWIITRDNSTPFGPYLCAGTLYAMLDWVRLWDWFQIYFLPPIFILPFLGAMLFALGVMLWIVHRIKMSWIAKGA